jgi:hypothetical protein
MAQVLNTKATGFSGWLGAESLLKVLGPMGNRILVAGSITAATDGVVSGINCEGVVQAGVTTTVGTYVITLAKPVSGVEAILGNVYNIVTATGAFVDDGTMIVPCALYGRLVTSATGGTAATSPSPHVEVTMVGVDGSKIDLSSAGANNSTKINFMLLCKR